LTTGGLVRIRSNDPAAALFSLGYDQSDSAFSIVAEATPGQPTITAPAVGSVNNKASNVTVSWTHQGGVGNPQVAFTLRWANNVAFTGPTTVGPTTTTTQSTAIDFSGQASGTTIYLEVKTQGVSIYSAYSNRVSFVVASVPATPNITAPINASPPTTPLPTITFTEADAFVSRKMRVTVAGIETYNSGEVVSAALSFASPYTFANGVAVVLYLSVKNSYGLWSVEDSETLTPSYAGPATPTISLTAFSDAGYILVTITNSDTPTYNEVWRRQLGQTATDAIQISPSSVAVDGTFLDYGVTSGITYVYFVRAYNALLYSTSADAQSSITLTQLVISLPTSTSSTSNASASASLLNQSAGPLNKQQVRATIKLIGRSSPVPLLGPTIGGALTQTVIILTSQPGLYATAMAILESGELVCVRDQFGNRVFGKVGNVQVTDVSTYWTINFTITETYHNESTTGPDSILATVAGFIPRDISGCTLWLEGDKITGVADGGAISSWIDSSGFANHAVQATGAKQPTLKTDWFNGLPAVRFDGTDDTLVTAAALWTGAQTRFLFAVYSALNVSGILYVAGQCTTTTSLTAFGIEPIIGGFSPKAAFPTNVLTGSGDVTSSTLCANLVTYDGTNATVHATALGVVTSTSSARALNTTSAGFRVGSRLTTGGTVEDRFLQGDVVLVVAGTGNLTNDDISHLFAYAIARYGST
jgi:hypothetical protein